MGQSASGSLVFGIDLGDAENLPEEFLARFNEDDGVDINVLIGLEANMCPRPDLPYDSPEDKAWRLRRDEKKKTYPLDLVIYVSYDYPAYVLAVKGTEQGFEWDCAEPIKFPLPAVTIGEKTALQDFCDRYGIKYKEPAWLLVARYT
jgi:hypothetical protein